MSNQAIEIAFDEHTRLTAAIAEHDAMLEHLKKELLCYVKNIPENTVALFFKTLTFLEENHGIKMEIFFNHADGILTAHSIKEGLSYDTIQLMCSKDFFSHAIISQKSYLSADICEKIESASDIFPVESICTSKIDQLAKTIAQKLFFARIDAY